MWFMAQSGAPGGSQRRASECGPLGKGKPWMGVPLVRPGGASGNVRNTAAHVNGDEVSRQDAEDSLSLNQALLHHLYVRRSCSMTCG